MQVSVASVFVFATFASVVLSSKALSLSKNGYYDTKYNHFDIEKILNNKRLVMYYAKCLTGDGPCTPQGTEFKRILPEALETNCNRCTEKQKMSAYLTIQRLQTEYPNIWKQLQASWDPTGEFVNKFIDTVVSTNNITQSTNINNITDSINLTTTTTLFMKTSYTPPFPLSSTSRLESTTIEFSTHRSSSRPNQFILLPKPEDIKKLPINLIASIGDIGTKVIQTGVRITDMVLSGLQASIAKII